MNLLCRPAQDDPNQGLQALRFACAVVEVDYDSLERRPPPLLQAHVASTAVGSSLAEAHSVKGKVAPNAFYKVQKGI